jgi:hypothetical protein
LTTVDCHAHANAYANAIGSWRNWSVVKITAQMVYLLNPHGSPRHHRKATQRKLQLADEHPTHSKQRLLSIRTTTHPLLHAVTNPVRSFDTFLPRLQGLVPINHRLPGRRVLRGNVALTPQHALCAATTTPWLPSSPSSSQNWFL